MTGFGWMDEKCGGASAGERGGDFVPDMPRLAHADHDDAPLALKDKLAGLDELRIDAGFELLDCLYLHADSALGSLDQLAALAHVRVVA